jgi:hypothetical protein
MAIKRMVLAAKDPFKSADGDGLPAYLYHGTLLETWEKHISKKGIDPKKTQNRGEHTKGFVFLGWDSRQAEEFAPGGMYSGHTVPGAIIRVTLDAELASKIVTRLGEFVRCPVLIPPSKLKLVKITNR